MLRKLSEIFAYKSLDHISAKDKTEEQLKRYSTKRKHNG